MISPNDAMEEDNSYGDFVQYDPGNQTWSNLPQPTDFLISDIPFLANVVLEDMVILTESVSYGGDGVKMRAYYPANAESEQWRTIADFPYTGYYYYSDRSSVGTSLQNKCYLKLGDSAFYSYDASNDTWEPMGGTLKYWYSPIVACGASATRMYIVQENNEVWQFDPAP